MPDTKATIAERVGEAARAFQQQLTGHAPKDVSVVLNEDTLVITLHGALTPAEQAMAADPAGAARVQEFHRQLFAGSVASLLDDIRRIVGIEVREAAVAVESTAGALVHAFTTGTVVQVFRLAKRLPTASLETLVAKPNPHSTPTAPPA